VQKDSRAVGEGGRDRRSAPGGTPSDPRRARLPAHFDLDAAGASLEELRRLQRVTDAALANLSVDELLDELLIRVREALSADTVAVLFLDERRGDLVARAAKGLEEEVRQGSRIPVGRGFAGTIAATGKPVRIFDVDHSIVLNPILRQRGVRSLLGVPLVVEGHIFGVLHVGTLTHRRFTSADEKFLQLVADRVALALHVGLYERERAVARTLQRSFLPERLPSVSGYQLAARYRPARQADVGGDWYDVFVLENGSVAIAIGDVAGKGIVAATTMARLRDALRAYALEFVSPSDVLNRLNRLLLHFDNDSMATVLYGVLDPVQNRFTFANAGHIPPIFGSPTQSRMTPATQSGPPLGVTHDCMYIDVGEELLPNATIVLCTDGLVERRYESLDVGVQQLCEASSADASPEEVADEIMHKLMPGGDQEDDAALLVLRASSTSEEDRVRSVPHLNQRSPSRATNVGDGLAKRTIELLD
jgi:sigma-B regulation protein RsbU (phosphoserine phosphatase)